ncbi:MAG: CHASE2 domain-containing protein, partial [Candidatus Nitrotoga sp.]
MPTLAAKFVHTLWIPLTALALTWALSFTPLYQQLDVLSLDKQTRLAAQQHFFQDALIIDIDDASLRAMQPYFGSWPYKRDTFALLLDYLGEMGARAVV